MHGERDRPTEGEMHEEVAEGGANEEMDEAILNCIQFLRNGGTVLRSGSWRETPPLEAR